MREVAWVVFDEIHYMRDKGILFEVAMYPLVVLMNTLEIIVRLIDHLVSTITILCLGNKLLTNEFYRWLLSLDTKFTCIVSHAPPRAQVLES